MPHTPCSSNKTVTREFFSDSPILMEVSDNTTSFLNQGIPILEEEEEEETENESAASLSAGDSNGKSPSSGAEFDNYEDSFSGSLPNFKIGGAGSVSELHAGHTNEEEEDESEDDVQGTNGCVSGFTGSGSYSADAIGDQEVDLPPFSHPAGASPPAHASSPARASSPATPATHSPAAVSPSSSSPVPASSSPVATAGFNTEKPLGASCIDGKAAAGQKDGENAVQGGNISGLGPASSPASTCHTPSPFPTMATAAAAEAPPSSTSQTTPIISLPATSSPPRNNQAGGILT